ncbi:MAG: 2'-deoxycytidine 5'-triphosphate deaminase [Patescibacteria group bacterium]|nr:2'-deoxycytidine 5'-triphosphate deaminase [Patescibacteria group bacterium]
MILGVDQLLKLVEEKNLVENLSERELTNPEGAGFDLRLGEIYELNGNSFLGVEERKTPKVELLEKYNSDKKSSFIFKPGCFYLIKTIESVNIPENILTLFTPRTTIFRSGMMIFTATCSPGYCGELTFAVANFGTCEVEIEMGARVVHAMFFQIEGKTNLYRGQWQGGRVSTEKKEKQV